RDQTASAEVPDVILQRGDVGVVGIRLCPSDDPAFSVASSQHLPGRRAREDELETNERSLVHHGVSWYGGISDVGTSSTASCEVFASTVAERIRSISGLLGNPWNLARVVFDRR
ncbi:hypothetical protein THAOC_23635, partial [Thalassiosira oceanica]